MTWTAPTATDLVVVTLGMATVLVAAVTSLPQLVHTVRGRTASGTSPAGLGNLAVGNVAWTLYSWWLGDVWLLVASAVAVPGALLAACAVWRRAGRAADLWLPGLWTALLVVSATAEALGWWRGLGLVVGCSICWLVVPCVVAAWRSPDVSGVSRGTWLLLLVEGVVAVGYGVASSTLAPAVFGVVECAGAVAVLARLARGRRMPPCVVVIPRPADRSQPRACERECA